MNKSIFLYSEESDIYFNQESSEEYRGKHTNYDTPEKCGTESFNNISTDHHQE